MPRPCAQPFFPLYPQAQKNSLATVAESKSRVGAHGEVRCHQESRESKRLVQRNCSCAEVYAICADLTKYAICADLTKYAICADLTKLNDSVLL